MKNKILEFSTNTQWDGKPEKTIDSEGKTIFLCNFILTRMI